MSENSRIEWTDATWNPVTGCRRVSAGCDRCYAIPMAARLAGVGNPRYKGLTERRGDRCDWTGEVRCHQDVLSWPLGRRKPKRVFVCSMSDLFNYEVPFVFIDQVFATMDTARQHTFIVCTKRPERMHDWFRASGWRDWVKPILSYKPPVPNVWLGVTAENQARFDQRVPHLMECPAAVRFVSLEPLLGPINLSPFLDGRDCPALDWLIVGGETGPGARDCNTDWIAEIIEQCAAGGVPVFVKQLGKNYQLGSRWNDCRRDTSAKGNKVNLWPEVMRVREYPRKRG